MLPILYLYSSSQFFFFHLSPPWGLQAAMSRAHTRIGPEEFSTTRCGTGENCVGICLWREDDTPFSDVNRALFDRCFLALFSQPTSLLLAGCWFRRYLYIYIYVCVCFMMFHLGESAIINDKWFDVFMHHASLPKSSNNSFTGM